MAIAFNEIPQNLRVPLFYAEINSGGQVYTDQGRVLLIGQKLAAGSAATEEPVLVPTGAEDELFGTNSMLAGMVRAARLNAPFAEIWAIAAADGAGAVASTGTIDLTTCTFPVAQATTLVIYIGGKRYRVRVDTTDTAITAAGNLVTEINDDVCQVVSATDNADGTITLTARHPGIQGNNVDIRTGYYGTEPSFANDITITAMAGGTADPDITNSLTALGDEAFDWIAMPYSDTANLDLVEDFLDNSVGRWSPMEQLYGHCSTYSVGTVGALSAVGLSRNDPHTTILGLYGFPTNPWEILAALVAKHAKHLSAAPELSRPLQFIELAGVMAPKITDRFARVDRNTLLYDGIATLVIAADNAVQIERSITTYRLNAVGFEDGTFLDVQTLAQNMYAIRYMRSRVTNRHGRTALGNDDNPPSQGVSRPRDVRGTIISAYVELNGLNVVENIDEFENRLIVERSATDPNRIDCYLPLDVINQLRVVAVNATTFLQFPTDA